MAHTKAGGSAKNLRDSNPKYLGVKKANGESVKTGQIIVRQRGTKIMPGNYVGMGVDHTLFAMTSGIVKFSTKRKGNFDGTRTVRALVEVVPTK